MGISTMVAAYKGLCVIMHHSHERNLRPWEQLGDDTEMGEERRESFSSVAKRNVQLGSRTAPDYDTDTDRSHTEVDANSNHDDDRSSFRGSFFNSFGAKNSADDASWVEVYQKKPLMRKVFDNTTWTQDETLRLLQDKIVLGANLWALILTIPLTAIFVALPKGNLY